MKASTQTPKWALELTEQVCKDYKRTLPGEFTWVHKRRIYSSGSTWSSKDKDGKPLYTYQFNRKKNEHKKVRFWGRIRVVSGVSLADQKLVLLHELAHWIAGKSKRECHSAKFWKTAFEMYERYGVDMDYAFNREKDYKKTAVAVYERYYKKEG